MVTSVKRSPVVSRSILISAVAWLVALAICLALWFLRVSGDLRSLSEARQELAKDRRLVTKIKKDLGETANLERKIVQAEAELYAITNAHLLTPLLNSHAMRAKELIQGAVNDSGFSLTEVRELYRIPLPVQNWSSSIFFMRIGVEIAGIGSYNEISELLALAEERLPYASVASFTISHQRTNPMRHRATIVLEWPALGSKPLPPPEPDDKRKRKRK